MSKKDETLQVLEHMDEEWQEDWDGKRIRAELSRLHKELEAMTQCAKNHDAARTKYLLLNQELLEALRQVVAVYDGNHVGWVVGMSFDKARAAIAKAEGETK